MKEINLNRKTIKRTIWCVLMVMVFVPWKNVFACSLPEPHVLIKCQIPPKYLQNETVCLDDECKYKIGVQADWPYKKGLLFNEQFLMYVNNDQLMAYELSDFQIVNQLCSENIEAFIPTFEQFHEDWQQFHRGKRIGSKLIIEPYSEVREAEFVKIQNDLLSCDNVIFEHVGGWLVSVESIKDYCITFDTQSCPYSETWISLFSLVGYLFTNLGPTTYPYLFGFLITLGISIYGFYVLYRRKEIAYFFSPTGCSLWVMIGLLPIYWTLFIFLPFKQILTFLLVGIYLILMITSYVYRRRKRFSERGNEVQD